MADKFELKDGNGSLFRNSKKEKETHADWTGEVKINGQLYWLNAWEKQGKNGLFFSISAKPKEASSAPKASTGRNDVYSDSIPF